jgi:hypothetical protein
MIPVSNNKILFLTRLHPLLPTAVNDHENTWHKEQRRNCGEKQSANHRAAERGILFAALSKP